MLLTEVFVETCTGQGFGWPDLGLLTGSVLKFKQEPDLAGVLLASHIEVGGLEQDGTLLLEITQDGL